MNLEVLKEFKDYKFIIKIVVVHAILIFIKIIKKQYIYALVLFQN